MVCKEQWMTAHTITCYIQIQFYSLQTWLPKSNCSPLSLVGGWPQMHVSINTDALCKRTFVNNFFWFYEGEFLVYWTSYCSNDKLVQKGDQKISCAISYILSPLLQNFIQEWKNVVLFLTKHFFLKYIELEYLRFVK